MEAEIFFNLDNPDFKEYGSSAVSQILKEITNSVVNGQESGVIRDSEDEIIGSWSIPLGYPSM